ncbi:hypothetical protein ACWDKQ_10285 [Saccharopolyspora sp. NPDC000995]
MPDPGLVPVDQVRAVFRQTAADVEQRVSPLPAHEITKRGQRRLRRQLAADVAGAAAAIIVSPSVAVNSRDRQPLVPAGPSSSQLSTPSAAFLPPISGPSSTWQPPASAHTLTPTEFR